MIRRRGDSGKYRLRREIDSPISDAGSRILVSSTTSETDLSAYTRRADNEVITGTWTFRSGKLQIGSGSDEDLVLLDVDVTGDPQMTWDESEDRFAFGKGLSISGILTMNDNRIIDVSDPTSQQDAATKYYVDMAVAAATWEFFLSNNASDIGGYYTLFAEETGETASSLTSSALGVGDDQLLWSFATESGLPNLEFLSLGVYTATFFAEASGNKTARLYWRLYKRAAGGAETLLMTSEESDELTDSLSQFVMSATVTEDIDVDTTDRLVLKVYANVTGSGNDVTVTFWMEGDYNSRIALRVAASAFSNLFVEKDGDTMSGDLTAPNLIATTAVQGPNVTSGADPGHTHTYSSISSVPDHDHSGDAGDVGQFAGLNALTDLDDDTYNAVAAAPLKSNVDGGLRLDHLNIGNVTGAVEGELKAAAAIYIGRDDAAESLLHLDGGASGSHEGGE